MLFSMFALGLTFQIMQTSIPKIFDIRIQNLSTFAIGAIIGVIYGLAGLMTLVGGIMADKFSLKKILYFKKADIFYYLFPRLYNFINYVRFRMRK